ncbi:MAG: LLM class flavin-dependent oxidoreductase [Acidimicrobiales bacterium]|nr:LLM class flavin-dependent oxidoreductase [Acidimicrobiales bacterium]
MRIGVSISSTQFVENHAEGAQHIVDRARAARDAGLDSLSLGDHHSMAIPYYQNVPMVGRLTAEWAPDRPLGCLFLLPLWNPVLVAEQIGTLAALHAAPFIVQTGIGGGADQFAAMGAELSTRGTVLDEAIRVVAALLAGETASSERFGITDARVNPRPPAGVEWWIGAGADGPLRRAARVGDAWYGGPNVTAADAPRMLDVYRSEANRLGRPHRAIVRKDVIILEDAARAEALGDDLFAAGYRGMPREAIVYGGVERVTAELGEYAALGFDDVIIRCMTIPQADALETLTLAGQVRSRLLA